MPDIKELKQEGDWDTIIKKSTDPMLVEFYAPWCEPCKELEPVLSKLSKEFGDITFYRYDVDKLYYRANVLGVKGIPVTVLLLPPKKIGEDAGIFDQIPGYVTTDMLRPKLAALVKKWKGA